MRREHMETLNRRWLRTSADYDDGQVAQACVDPVAAALIGAALLAAALFAHTEPASAPERPAPMRDAAVAAPAPR